MKNEAATGGLIRAMTWNIHGGVGMDGRYDLERVLSRVRVLDPDIAAFQEVDSRGRPGAASDFERLAEAAGGHHIAARTIVAPDGHYGHMLVSRWPIGRVELHDITVRRREPRFAIEAEVEHPVARLHVVAVHVGLDWRERRRQAARLAAVAERWPELTLMMGDFNDWSPLGLLRRRLAQAFTGRSKPATFPSRLPLLRLDRIYARPAGALRATWVDTAAAFASDHLPLLASIDSTVLPRRLTGDGVASATGGAIAAIGTELDADR